MNYFPALIIGSGGSGTTMIRMIKTRAKTDPNLAEMLKNNAIQLLAFDTDPGSGYDPYVLDPHLSHIEGLSPDSCEKLPSALEPLSDEFRVFKREELNNAIKMLNSDNPRKKDTLPEISAWFPKKDPKNGEFLNLGDTKYAGASQYRPLGRLALFLNQGMVKQALGEACGKVVNNLEKDQPLRVYICCSLAGGTGSGTFWDLAFLIQSLSLTPDTLTTGMFLLGEPFRGLETGGRIRENVYAALKEIHNLKNFHQEINVEYPGESFRGTPNVRAYDNIFLFQDFPVGSGVKDLPKGRVDISCFRISESIMTRLRKDVAMQFKEADQNRSGDSTRKPGERESRYVFSTCCSSIFPLEDTERWEEYFINKVMLRLRSGDALGNKKLDSSRVESIMADIGLNIDDPLSGFISRVTNILAGDQNDATRLIRDWSEGIEEAIRKLEDRKSFTESLSGLPSRISEAIRNADGLNHDAPMPAITKKMEDSFIGKISSLKQSLEDAFKPILRGSVDNTFLDKDAYLFVQNLIKALERSKVHKVNSAPEVSIQIPNDLLKVKPIFGKLEPESTFVRFFSSLFGAQDEKLQRDILITGLGNIREQLNNLVINESFYQDKAKALWVERVNDFIYVMRRVLSRSDENQGLFIAEQKRIEGLDGFFKTIISNRVEQPANPLDFTKKLMPPIIDESGIIKNTPENEEWKAKHLEALRRVLNQCEGQLFAIPDFDTFRDLLDGMTGALARKRSDLSPVFDFIESLIPKKKMHSVDDARELHQNVQRLCSVFTGYWVLSSNILDRWAGGSDSLKKRLAACSPNIFVGGRLINTINTKRLTILPFNDRFDGVDPNTLEKMTDEFKAQAHTIHSSVETRISSLNTEEPVVIFEDLFRSAEEIRCINSYFVEYSGLRPHMRTFHHIDRAWAGFPEIIEEEIEPVFCGNEGCDANIANEPRTALFCHECNKPIKNRCGNRDCFDNNIALKLKRLAARDRHLDNLENCPECNQALHTYWWKCEEHKLNITMEQHNCPSCEKEWKNQKRKVEDISRRPDLTRFPCPGCLKVNGTGMVPFAMKKFYKNGVTSDEKPGFLAMAQRFSLDSLFCDSGQHAVFPHCIQHEIHNNDAAQYLYRDKSGSFICDHVDHNHVFYECSACGFPLPSDFNEGTCPRCKEVLVNCPFCSVKTRRFYHAVKDNEHCIFCDNRIQPLETYNNESLVAKLNFPGVCPNPYLCRAGQKPWSTTRESLENDKLAHCKACFGNERFPLVQLNALEEALRNCPLCMQVYSPIPRDFNVEVPVTEEKIRAYFAEKATTDQSAHIEEKCGVCGTEPLMILRWMFGDDYIKELGFQPPEQTGEHGPERHLDDTSPPQSGYPPFAAVISLLQLLRNHPEDKVVFSQLNGEIHQIRSFDEKFVTPILRLFPKDRPMRRTLEARLHSLRDKKAKLDSGSNFIKGGKLHD